MRSLSSLVLLAACAGGNEPRLVDSDDPTPEPPCGPSAERGLAVGQCAPDFTLPDQTRLPFTLSAQRGKVALVDISAVW